MARPTSSEVAGVGCADGRRTATSPSTRTAGDWTYALVHERVNGLAADDVRYDTLTVTSADGTPQDIIVTVNGTNDAPVIGSNGGGASASISVAENVRTVTTIQATDVDNASLTYSIVTGSESADAARFSIDAATGALRFIDAPVFGTPVDSDGDNVYVVQVSASDGIISDLQTLTVNVTEEENISCSRARAGHAAQRNFYANTHPGRRSLRGWFVVERRVVVDGRRSAGNHRRGHNHRRHRRRGAGASARHGLPDFHHRQRRRQYRRHDTKHRHALWCGRTARRRRCDRWRDFCR